MFLLSENLDSKKLTLCYSKINLFFYSSAQDIKSKRIQLPEVDRTSLEPAPIVVGIVGPPKVGKSTLMQGLIRNFTRQKLTNINGPVTVVTSKKRRLTFIECNNDINSMIDIAKVSDLVSLMIKYSLISIYSLF
jgi:ribosome biogenesis protein BMS1